MVVLLLVCAENILVYWIKRPRITSASWKNKHKIQPDSCEKVVFHHTNILRDDPTFYFESLLSSSQIDWNSDWYISRNTWIGSSLAPIHDTALQGSRLAALCWVTHCRAATWKSLTATQPHRRGKKEAVYVSSASSHNPFFFNFGRNSVWLAGRLSATLAS